MGNPTTAKNRCDNWAEEDWDLIGAIQESFEVTFTSDELDSARTVEELHRILVAKLGESAPEKCLSATTFYQVRRALTAVCGVSRCAIGPDTRLTQIMPARQRRRQLRQLEESLNRAMPSLGYPAGVLLSTFAVSALLIGSVVRHYGAGLPIGIFGTLMLFVILIGFVLKPLAIIFPVGYETVGDMVKSVVAYNFKIIANNAGGWSERESMESLRIVIASQASVDLKEITAQSRFPIFS